MTVSWPMNSTWVWASFFKRLLLSNNFIGSLVVWLLLAVTPASSLAKVYYSKQEALELAFGKDAEVAMLPLFLTADQKRRIQQMARVKLESDLYTFYVGKKNGQILGYAAIESHTVRTKPETLLIVLSAAGELRRVEVLAFHEPPEYQPPGRWFERLYSRSLDELRLGGQVDAISGATLSTRAALDSIRKVLAIYQVAVAGGDDR